MNSILKQIKSAGYEAYFVGGCVRDTLMGLVPKDWDVATNATPEQIMELFPHDHIPIGAKFGVVMVRHNGQFFEVATFRKEGDHDGHKCSVSWTDLHNDASRRDFTINAMYMDDRDVVIDLFGGQKDIENNVLRTVGNPERRFREDPLRMLRAIRFAAKYGMKLDMVMNGALLSTISAERIKDELLKILAVGGLRLLSDTGLLAHILPEIEQLREVEQDARHPEGNVFEHTCRVVEAMQKAVCPNDPVCLMAALLHDVGKFETQEIHPDGKISFINHEDSVLPEQIMKRLKFSNDEIESVTWLVQNHMRMHKFFEMKKSKRHTLMLNKNWLSLRWLHMADCLGSNKGFDPAFKIRDYCNTVVLQEPKVLSDRLVNGHDLIALGYAPGKEMGELLDKLEEAQREGKFDTKEKGLDFLRTL